MINVKAFGFIFLCLFSALLHASPWVEPNNLALRTNIQLLADSGIIKAPVTTYPLMWQAIITDIKSAKSTEHYSSLPKAQQLAVSMVLNAYQRTQASSNSQFGVKVSSENNRFTHFGDNYTNQGGIYISHQFQTNYVSGQLKVNKVFGQTDVSQALNENSINLDDSYVALRLGNWLVSAGAVRKWWGPGLDTSLIMSTNARPLPAVSLTRNKSTAFKTPWLNWIGPWTFTAQMAQLESSRVVPNARMWSSRATMRPFAGLELGASWSFQWGGDGFPDSFSDFFTTLQGGQECFSGGETCDKSDHSYLGNHVAGYDMRWSSELSGVPFAIYAQRVGEDGAPGFGLVTDKANLFGGELRFSGFNQYFLFNLEYTNTQVKCGNNGEQTLNCYYEHSTYRSGYRYNGRAIGATYDNDAKALAVMLQGQLLNGNNWLVKLRSVKLNTDNLDVFPDHITRGNTVSKGYEQLTQLDSQYNFTWHDMNLQLGALLEKSTVQQQSDTDVSIYARLESVF